MNIPGLTAEGSLYKTSGHYQTGRQVINLPTQMIGTVHVAAIDMGEVIEVLGEAPMELPWEWGPGGWNWGGGGGTVTSGGGPSGGAGGTGPGGDRPGGDTGRPPRPMQIVTLGQGPMYSKIRDVFTCNNAGVGAEICHSCSDNPAGRTCTCFYCVPSSDQCTEGYTDGCPP